MEWVHSRVRIKIPVEALPALGAPYKVWNTGVWKQRIKKEINKKYSTTVTVHLESMFVNFLVYTYPHDRLTKWRILLKILYPKLVAHEKTSHRSSNILMIHEHWPKWIKSFQSIIYVNYRKQQTTNVPTVFFITR